MPPRSSIVARWLALPAGPFQSRLLAGRTNRDGSVCICYLTLPRLAALERCAALERRDDGEDDLSGIEGLFWNLVAS